MGIIKITGEQAKNLRGTTDWHKVKQLTDAQIRAASLADPSAPEIKPVELALFKRDQKK